MKKQIAAVLAALSLITIPGCSEKGGNTPGLIIGEGERLALSPITLTESNTENSIRLFDAISADSGNNMFSPLSLNMALGMLAEGAGGSTEAALDAYLRTDDYGEFARSYMKLAAENYNLDSSGSKRKNIFEIANSFWASEAVPFKDGYKTALSDKYGAEIRNMDFGDKSGTISAINGWVKEKTHGMIPAVVDDYSDDIMSVLVNTVYFESGWVNDWKCNDKNKHTFTLSDGNTKELPLMSTGTSRYYENSFAEAFGCKYKNGLSFIGILPKQTGSFTLESLDIPSLLESESFDYDVSASMPRLEFDSAFSLRDALSAAGMSEIFDICADFSGMSEVPSYVTEIIQKTRLEHDEYGTKAAAVSAAITNKANYVDVGREKKTIVLDRPFAFLIYDSAEDQIVFVGKVTDP